MKLYYRGLSYEYNPSKVDSKKTEQPFQPVPQLGPAYNLMYCGINYHVDPNSKSAEVPLSPVAYKLSFRGITYFVNKTAQGEVTVVSQPARTSKVVALPISKQLKLQ
ncbi:DUF4278 domain-containing protein [Nostoc sp. UCD121]|uniref:DUF4278 domain-containing protein n=1 Tax=unclassified Nostoc TaxID=2593658 RepID=UPI0016252CDE|nr:MULTISPECIES: DUF4278 domain-containing protein [unclassified Nostoc]MBC1224039.1 DUF4278 domain-containing protein [Nostoc sp. UCD120]MBC1276097.1 DUF4278 domain-containing protein [Nostoc sp. UCD121]MBC1294640.1 DUF4278 domain-containing protein [Nostoc sp. UCD122]